MTSPHPLLSALLRAEPGSERFLAFAEPVEAFVATAPDEVPGLLAEVERESARGLWAVGFVGYEAASAFDAALRTHPPTGPAPLAAFSLFSAPREVELSDAAESKPATLGPRSARWSEDDHARGVAAIREAIAAGATYQVNLVFPFEGGFEGSPRALFASLLARGEAPYAALLEGEDWALASLSPELFFERRAGQVTMRPMKGTRARGRFEAEDRALATELGASEKERAENLMIVDMVRNDLGRVAAAGSVEVTRRFEVEPYPTVWQMTSTVEARSDAQLPELFGALFPCASVTGAPKAATMGIIRELEASPRGAYCGAIGRVEPGGAARFAVAIRTLELDLARSSYRYGVGSGVTWDSGAAAEWRECHEKARVLDGPPPSFDLFETMRLRPCARPGCEPAAIALLELHLARLSASAERFDFARRGEELVLAARALVTARAAALAPGSYRLRLQLSPGGELALAAEPFAKERRTWTFAIDPVPVDSHDLLLFHKTTRRERYDAARARAAANIDETLLVNERGELTEGTRTNLFVDFGSGWLTPPVEAGLLPGVFRTALLRSGRVHEAPILPSDLARAHRIRLGNALRGWIVARPGPAECNPDAAPA